ncbi:MAG: AraC family transcriptional regulator [Lentisphaeria bacterium]|nr:AraC family transcriptional regulator [Lentisphaeria bacterium]
MNGRRTVRPVDYSTGNSRLFGQNVGDYPEHHFYLASLNDENPDTPFFVSVCGSDIWCEGVVRERKNCNLCSFELVEEGEFRYWFNGMDFTCRAGDLFILHYNSGNRIECVSEYGKFSTLVFAGKQLPTILGQLGLDAIPFIHLRDPRMILDHFHRTVEIYRSGVAEKFREISAIGYRVLLDLAAELAHSRKKFPPQLLDMMNYVEKHIGKKLTVAALAAHFGVCNGTVFALFRKYLDTSPILYLIGLRMKYAMRMLAESEFSIKEISVRCGYDNQLYFSQDFKRRCGVSPSGYRARIRSPQGV